MVYNDSRSWNELHMRVLKNDKSNKYDDDLQYGDVNGTGPGTELLVFHSKLG